MDKNLQRAIINNGIANVALDKSLIIPDEKNINWTYAIDPAVPVHSQKQSGRCWLFSALVEQEVGCKTVLSKSYLYFWDKYNMAKVFYQAIVDTKNLDITSAEVQHLFDFPTREGGFYAKAQHLIATYGLVPQSIMPETATSVDSANFEIILNDKLRVDAYKIREQNFTDIDKLLGEVKQYLEYCLGTPPETFTYQNKEYTPLEFYKQFGQNVDGLVQIDFFTDAKKNEFNQLYKIKHADWYWRKNTCLAAAQLNDSIINSCIESIKSGRPLWFLWDVSKQFDRDSGTLNASLFKNDELFNFESVLPKDKRELYRSFDYWHLHATSIVAVYIENDTPKYWKVKNSWGDGTCPVRGKVAGQYGGYLLLEHSYFKEYIMSLAIDKQFLPKDIAQIFTQEPIELQYY